MLCDASALGRLKANRKKTTKKKRAKCAKKREKARKGAKMHVCFGRKFCAKCAKKREKARKCNTSVLATLRKAFGVQQALRGP